MDKKQHNIYGQLEDLFSFVLNNVDRSKLSQKNKEHIVKEVLGLRSFVVGARPARIAIVGRRGAGKSSLINAIFGEKRAAIGDYKSQTGRGNWYLYENEHGGIDILDTRGLGESHRPEEVSDAQTPLDELKQALADKCPDIILFLCKAKEVGSRLDEDLVQLQELKQAVTSIHQYDVPIVGVVTQVDELAPLSDQTPPFISEQKQKNIQATVALLEEKLTEAVMQPIIVIPTSAYIEFDGDHIAYDLRWNIDTLLDFLIAELPNEAQVIMAKLSKVKSVQKKLARRIGKSVMAVTGVIGATPIPVADMPVITGLQVSMVGTVAMISGKRLNRRTIIEFIGAMGLNIGLGVALREISRQLVKVFPGVGSVISGTVASAGTYALCEAAIAYFIENESKETAKAVYDQKFKEEKAKKRMDELDNNG